MTFSFSRNEAQNWASKLTNASVCISIYELTKAPRDCPHCPPMIVRHLVIWTSVDDTKWVGRERDYPSHIRLDPLLSKGACPRICRGTCPRIASPPNNTFYVRESYWQHLMPTLFITLDNSRFKRSQFMQFLSLAHFLMVFLFPGNTLDQVMSQKKQV